MREPLILLGPGEVATAAQLAALRQSVNRRAGTLNLKAGKQDPMTTELVGTFGEIALASYLNVMPDLTTHLRRGSADALWRGWTVDVKSTRNPHGELWVDIRADKHADLYVLVYVAWCACEVKGFLRRSDMRARRWVRTDTGAKFAQSELDPPDLLWNIEPHHSLTTDNP